jgi:hypothetical protein
MIDSRIIEELKAKHPGLKLHLLGDEDAQVVVRVPSPAIYRKGKAKSRDEKTSLDANETLVRDCLVYPDQVAFGAMLEEYPGLADTFATALMGLAKSLKDCEVVPL